MNNKNIKSTILAGFAALALLTSVNARAEGSPAWVCALDFNGRAEGFQVIVGHFKMEGTGELSCANLDGRREAIPVKLTMGSRFLAPEFSFGGFDIYGAAAEIALTDGSPRDLLGRYLVAHGQGSIVGGAGVITGVHASDSALSLLLSIQFLHGVGFSVGINSLDLAAAE